MRGKATNGKREPKIAQNLMQLIATFSWNIVALETRREVLEWYLNFNAGGSAHTHEELEKMRKLLEKEK